MKCPYKSQNIQFKTIVRGLMFTRYPNSPWVTQDSNLNKVSHTPTVQQSVDSGPVADDEQLTPCASSSSDIGPARQTHDVLQTTRSKSHFSGDMYPLLGLTHRGLITQQINDDLLITQPNSRRRYISFTRPYTQRTKNTADKRRSANHTAALTATIYILP